MNLLDKIGREFSGYNLLESGKRIFDRKPLQCSLYLTDKCNLDCSYCTEYDNSKPHPKLEDLKLWIRKIRDLGTMRIALVGGEPLLHPDVVEIVRYCRELGFATSLTTNGFLLTRKLLKELEEAGLQVMQISVDRMASAFRGRKLSATSACAHDGFVRSAATSSGEFEMMVASRNPSRCTTRSSRSRSEIPKRVQSASGALARMSNCGRDDSMKRRRRSRKVLLPLRVKLP